MVTKTTLKVLKKWYFFAINRSYIDLTRDDISSYSSDREEDLPSVPIALTSTSVRYTS